MNSIMNSTMKRGRLLFSALMLAGFSLAPSASAAPSPAWLWLTADSVVNCAWTVTVNWGGFNGAKTLEVFVTETYLGSPLVPKFTPIHGKSGTAAVTLDPLSVSASPNYFYAWAQLLDSHGVAIPASLDFAGQQLEYCTP